MRSRALKRTKAVPRAIKLIIYALLLSAALYAGMFGGDFLFDSELDETVKNLDTGNLLDTGYLKNMLNSSVILIDTVYNSGNASTSVSGAINDTVSFLFGFNLDDPKSIITAQNSFLRGFNLAGNEMEPVAHDIAEETGSNGDIGPDSGYMADTGGQEQPDALPEAASSISMDAEVEERNIEKSDLVSSEGIALRNETSRKIDIMKLLNEPLAYEFNKDNSQVLIYHTHTTESFLKNLGELNKPDVLNRNRDLRYSVVRVGGELANYLRNTHKIQVVHNATIHDYPDYNKSYVNALTTVTNVLKGNQSIRMVFDIHRDAVKGEKLRVVKDVDGKNAAQIMFVVTTGELGGSHPQWEENMKLALKLQKKLNDLCPGLARPIYVSKYRYNQHLSPGALLVEIGGDGNLLEECLLSTKYLAEAINQVIEE